MKTLETDRLILRSWKYDDLNDFYEYAKNPNVGPSAGWIPHQNIEESQGILADFIEKDETWAIQDRESGKLIGSLGLHEDKLRRDINARMIGYVLAEPYWGRGLMTEAVKRVIRYVFEETDIEVLSVGHYTFNTGSKRVIEKCGFVYEGTLRHASLTRYGKIFDCSNYSILREEYKPEKYI